MGSKSAVFILPVTSQPRYLKRVQAIKNNDFDCKVFSFERKYFEGNNLDSFISLGKIEHGNYLKRSNTLIKAFLKLLSNKHIFKEAKIVYVFGLDNMILINILMKVLRLNTRIIYEVADIRKIMFSKSLVGSLLKSVEKRLVERSYLTTVTSPFFVSDYYESVLNIDKSKFLVIENKLYEPVPDRIIREDCQENKLVIGFFGLLRSQQSWDLLYNLAKSYPNYIEIYIRGYLLNLSEFEERINELDNINFGGEYKSPNDLAEMYSEIDISLIGNISDNVQNVNLALPNRFYESIHYRKPMLTHCNTAVSRKMNSLGVGWEIDFMNIEESISKIVNIDKSEYKKIKDNTYIDATETLGDYDHKILIDLINKK